MPLSVCRLARAIQRVPLRRMPGNLNGMLDGMLDGMADGIAISMGK